MRKVLVVSLCLLFVMSSLALARNDSQGKDPLNKKVQIGNSGLINLDLPLDQQGLHATAQADTYVLGSWTFDAAGACTNEGWISVDRTLQDGCYWHIDDFAGLGGGSYGNLVPIRGLQSLWCGMRPNAVDLTLCGYATPPGYGNGWNQSWVYKCITVPDTEEVYIDYITSFDSEPGYDGTSIEYASKSTCDSLGHIDGIAAADWTEIAYYDGFASDSLRSDTIPAGHNGSVKIRFRFTSDGAWSDQDGLWNTDGGVQLDSVSVTAEISGVYDYEDFEDEIVGHGHTTDLDWECQIYTGYGAQYAALYPGLSQVQEDPCRTEVSCVWAFINTSTETYACGGFPGQISVPKENERGQFISNEIWSPPFPWTGTGSVADLTYDCYYDMPIPNLVFSVWGVRSWVAGCPYTWRDRNYVYYGDGKNWGATVRPCGDLIRGDAEEVQVSLGVVDMCGVWCGGSWTGACHSHSPMYDNVEFYRVGTTGPQWSVRDIDQFQDTFPTNGFAVGTGRVDAAIDRQPYTSPSIYVGDSASVLCSDPTDGLVDPEPYTGFGGAVYAYFSISPPAQPGKMTPAELEEDGFRWPMVDSVMCDGKMWYKFRCDTAFTSPDALNPRSGAVPDKWCIDINDNVITNGDTLEYFYGAVGNTSETFWSRGAGTVTTIGEVCVLANEMQILPGVGNGTDEYDILYVDSFDGRGGQPYFESAFQMMGILDNVDRYDVNGPSSGVANHPGNRVRNVFTQLIPIYRKIIWSTGNLATAVSDIGPTPDKSDDWAMLFTFMDQHTNASGCGVYLSGDDLADSWSGLAGASASQFRDVYMPHLVVSGSQVLTHGVAPLVIGEDGGIFDHGVPLEEDTIVAYGGCPGINDFDVLQPIGSSQLQATYNGTGNATDGAVISFDSTNALGNPAKVVLSGFSFHYIRDDRPAGIPDRADHMTDIIRFLNNIVPDPVGGDTPVSYTYNLRQNYPNPFNPSTRIQYSIKERAHVTLKIYNVAGQLVKTLVNKEQSPRADGYTVQWRGRSDAGTPVSSGVYFYKLVAKNFTQTKKMVLLK